MSGHGPRRIDAELSQYARQSRKRTNGRRGLHTAGGNFKTAEAHIRKPRCESQYIQSIAAPDFKHAAGPQAFDGSEEEPMVNPLLALRKCFEGLVPKQIVGFKF